MAVLDAKRLQFNYVPMSGDVDGERRFAASADIFVSSCEINAAQRNASVSRWSCR